MPEPDNPWTKLKQVYAKVYKGPVSAITSIMSFLVPSVGQKGHLWQLKDEDIVGVAFIDTNIFIYQMVSIKSLILVADVYKSVTVLRFQNGFQTLSMVSRDYNPLIVYQVVDNGNLAFLASDSVPASRRFESEIISRFEWRLRVRQLSNNISFHFDCMSCKC